MKAEFVPVKNGNEHIFKSNKLHMRQFILRFLIFYITGVYMSFSGVIAWHIIIAAVDF